MSGMDAYSFDVERFEANMRRHRRKREAQRIAKQKRVRRRKIMTIGLCMSLVVAFTAFVGAYMSDADQLRNQISIGGSSIDIVEEFDPPKELTPGVSFTKNVSVINNGPNACYVRVLAVFTDSDMGDYCTVDWNTTDWVYNSEDGYWYYINPVADSTATTSLFTTITLSGDIPESSINSFDMLVYAECYQADGFDDYEAAWAHYHVNKPV